MRRGWKTSEFWIAATSIVGAVATVIAGLPIAAVAVPAASVMGGAYAIARAIEKYAHATSSSPPPKPDGLQ